MAQSYGNGYGSWTLNYGCTPGPDWLKFDFYLDLSGSAQAAWNGSNPRLNGAGQSVSSTGVHGGAGRYPLGSITVGGLGYGTHGWTFSYTTGSNVRLYIYGGGVQQVNSWEVYASGTTTTPPKPNPVTINPQPASSSSINLNRWWGSTATACQYNINGWGWLAEGGAYSNGVRCNGNMVTGLSRYTRYSCQIRMCNNNSGWNTTGVSYAYTNPEVPTVSALTVSNIGDFSFDASFSCSDDGGKALTDYGIQIFTNSSCTQEVVAKKVTGAYSGTFSSLDFHRDYWVRGYATNGITVGYTTPVKVTTTYTESTNPSNVELTQDLPEPCDESMFTVTWDAGASGSKSIDGYRLYLYKNGSMIKYVDVEGTLTYSFDALFISAKEHDIVQVKAVSYMKDWNNVKLLSGNKGTTQEPSNSITLWAARYAWVSENGGAFTKRKVFMSQDGSDFQEVKKGWNGPNSVI